MMTNEKLSWEVTTLIQLYREHFGEFPDTTQDALHWGYNVGLISAGEHGRLSAYLQTSI